MQVRGCGGRPGRAAAGDALEPRRAESRTPRRLSARCLRAKAGAEHRWAGRLLPAGSVPPVGEANLSPSSLPSRVAPHPRSRRCLRRSGGGRGGKRRREGRAGQRSPPLPPGRPPRWPGTALPAPQPERCSRAGLREVPPALLGGGGGEKRALTLLELWVDNSLYFREVSSCPYPAPTVRRSQPPFRLVGNPVVYF